MILSENEIITILKKELPKADYRQLASIATSITDHAKHWQEVDLNEHIHDDVEKDFLHEICKRESNSKPFKGIKLFYKE